jgi:hypothetical protein
MLRGELRQPQKGAAPCCLKGLQAAQQRWQGAGRQKQVHQRDLGRNLTCQIADQHGTRCSGAGRFFGFSQPMHRRLRWREVLLRSTAPQPYL